MPPSELLKTLEETLRDIESYLSCRLLTQKLEDKRVSLMKRYHAIKPSNSSLKNFLSNSTSVMEKLIRDLRAFDEELRDTNLLCKIRVFTPDGFEFPISFDLQQGGLPWGGTADLFIGEALGEQGLKVVLKRPRLALDKRVDAAVLAKDLERFGREEGYWRILDSPFVLPLMGRCKIGGYLHLVTRLMANGDLGHFTRENPKAPTLMLLLETSCGLQYLHESGLVHGDVKPENVLVDDRAHAKICDFGLSRFYNQHTSMGQKGHGTVHFQSHEIIGTSGRKSTSSDMYAFGMTIAQVLQKSLQPFPNLPTDGNPFWSELSRMPVKRPVEPQSSPSFRQQQSAAWRVAVQCWEEIPEQRISATEARRQLEDIVRVRT